MLLYHDISPHELDSFAQQIDYFVKAYNFITPSEFESHMSGETVLKGHNLLITFDDGFLSNKEAAEVLNQRNIKAIFFVVSDFVSLAEDSEAKRFIAKNMYPDMVQEEIPPLWKNMNWDDLRVLLSNGHTIGAHTRSHKRVSALEDELDIYSEIIKSAQVIESQLDIKVDHFAFPFGNIKSLSQTALSVATTKFKFIHSGFRGFNRTILCSSLVRRDSFTPTLNLNEIDFYLHGFSDYYYRDDVQTFVRWESSSNQINDSI